MDSVFLIHRQLFANLQHLLCVTEVSPGHTATVCRKVESDQATCGITLRSEVTESVQNAQALQSVKKISTAFLFLLV